MTGTERQTYRSFGVSAGLLVALFVVGGLVLWLLPDLPTAVGRGLVVVIAVLAGWRALNLRVVVDDAGLTWHGVFRSRQYRWADVATVVVGDRDNVHNTDVTLELAAGGPVTLHALSPPTVPWLRWWNRYRDMETLREWERRYGVGVEDRRTRSER